MSDFPVHTIIVTRVTYEEPRGNYLTEPPMCEYEIAHGICGVRRGDRGGRR